MDIKFVTPELTRLDALRSEALAIPLFEDDTPLPGTIGLCDWRMCGLISRLVLRGRIHGEWKEQVLVAARPKLPFDKVLLFGAGLRAQFTEEHFVTAVSDIFSTLTRARVRSSVLVLPGRAQGLVSAPRAMELFLGLVQEHVEHDEVTLVEDADSQRAMMPVIERERRRARADAAT